MIFGSIFITILPIFIGYTKKDYSWSVGPSSRVIFASIRFQRKRLEKFCEECNKYLKSK